MSKIIIGIDPDSKVHGVAVYVDGKLMGLSGLELTQFIDMIPKWKSEFDSLEVHIEDVNAVSAAFMARDRKANINVKLKMAQHIGMCKQAQIELERLFASHLIVPIKHKISQMWKKDKAQFEKVTGWTGRSNEDTRSAAWMGYQGLTN